MELYDSTSYELAERFTKRYSTSFSMSSRLFEASIRSHIYAIYGMVRLADEIVDTYKRADAAEQLDSFHNEVLQAVSTGYSFNPLVHAFALTARRYAITRELIDPFFTSMSMDLTAQTFDADMYQNYVYGSAEVVGLMCLRVFVDGEDQSYESLKKGAQALGAAYQEVNFLRDFKADHEGLGRIYFPGVTFDTFDETAKQQIITAIDSRFVTARSYIDRLPESSRRAVLTSWYYYKELLDTLRAASSETIKANRLRVPNAKKIVLLLRAKL